MKKILLWDSRFPKRDPIRLNVVDSIASAIVRSGVGTAADPADVGALSAGGALDPGLPTEVVLQHGSSNNLTTRVVLPYSVVLVGAAAGLLASIGSPITGMQPPPPTVTLSASISKAEGNSGANLYTYTVTRSATAGAVAVPWSFTPGNTSADDFTGGVYPAGGSVALADGQASGTFSVSVNGDTFVEGDEMFNVYISTPNGYVAGASTSATGTILNEDVAAALVAPYNQLFVMGPGDSRTVMGGGRSGTYGVSVGQIDALDSSSGSSYNGYMATALDNRLREGSRLPNMGTGGATAAQVLAYPRPATNSGNTGRIDSGTAGTPGNTLTITVKSGGDSFAVGQQVQLSGGTTCNITALGTGTGGVGTYTVDGPAQSVASTATVIPYWLQGTASVPGKTIADVAAHEAAVVVLWLGTNGIGAASELAAMDTAIRGLTDPTFSYPGYGSPLPLYQGRPKTVIVLNDTRRGITATGAVNQQNTPANAAQFTAYARTLKRYSFDSGDSTYANTRVVVVDTYDAPTLADLTDTSTYNPLPGLFADGLHPAAPAVARIGKIIGDRVGPALPASFLSLAHLVDTTTAANYLIQNPCFATTAGGTNQASSVILTGTVPQFWTLGGGASGLTLDISFNALGGALGNELVMHVTGTPSATTAITLTGLASAASRALVNLATDAIRGAFREKLIVTSGSISSAYWSVQLGSYPNAVTSSTSFHEQATGYGGNSSFPLFIKNANADGSNPAYATKQTRNIDAIGLATGNPAALTAFYTIAMLGGVAVDFTVTLSQVSVGKVTD